MLLSKYSRGFIKRLGLPFPFLLKAIFSPFPMYVFSKGGPSFFNNNHVAQQPAIKTILKYSQLLSQSKEKEESISFKKKYLRMEQCFKNVGVRPHDIAQSFYSLANSLMVIISQDKKKAEQVMSCLSELQKYIYQDGQIQNLDPAQTAVYFLSIQMKLECIVNLFKQKEEIEQQCLISHGIFDCTQGSNEFEYIWQRINTSQLKGIKKETYQLAYKAFKNCLILVTNAVIVENGSARQDQLSRKIAFLLSFPISLANLKKAELNCYNLWRRPTLVGVKQLLDLPDKGYIRKMKDLAFPSVKYKKFLYPHYSYHGQKSNSYQRESNIFQMSQNSGRILILHHRQLQQKKKGHNCSSENIDTIIIYIHGGGFISMSSQIYQGVTIPWANQLKVPVLSIDYRKPPSQPFPTPLQDCLNAYKFITLHISQYYNINPKHIILAGDSAGGNLACSLQIMLMKQKFKILPKGILLVYPALDLRIKYSPSRLQCFNDGILIPSLLLLCQRQYLQGSKLPQNHPLISPLLVTESFINPERDGCQQGRKWPREWPRTSIMVGKKDPLFDDSLILLSRLAKDNISCEMILYEDFSHGFMLLDKVLPGCRDTIKDSISQIKKLMESC